VPENVVEPALRAALAEELWRRLRAITLVAPLCKRLSHEAWA
jgi:hypothetical protein